MLDNSGPIALFSNYKLTSSSGRHLQDINHAHIVSLLYKIITSSKDSDDLSIGFDRSRDKRQLELTNNKYKKGKFQGKNYLKDRFGFAEHQERGTYGLGNELTLTRNSDNAVLNKDNATAVGEIKINSIEWYVPQYGASVKEQGKIMEHIIDKITTELQYVERSVFMKEVNTQNLWSFELGSLKNMNVLIRIFIGFHQRDRQDSQNLADDNFFRPPVTSAQCIISTEKCPDSATLLNYDDDDYSQRYGLTKEAFRALTKDDILKPKISNQNFRSSNDSDDIGYKLYVFDIRYPKNFESAQLIKVEYKSDGVIPAGRYGYALVLTNKLLCISSDDKPFDLI